MVAVARQHRSAVSFRFLFVPDCQGIAEVKVDYVGGKSSKAQIENSFFLFFPKELASAVPTDFYANLWENLRVDIREVISDMAELRSERFSSGRSTGLLQLSLRETLGALHSLPVMHF